MFATSLFVQSLGLRLGGAKDFVIGVSTVLFPSYRKRQYAAYSAILDSRGNEDEQGRLHLHPARATAGGV